MNYHWQQPLHPLQFKYQLEDCTWSEWAPVLFIRPSEFDLEHNYDEWQIMSLNGVIHSPRTTLLRFAP
jgi:hypothetical protein